MLRGDGLSLPCGLTSLSWNPYIISNQPVKSYWAYIEWECYKVKDYTYITRCCKFHLSFGYISKYCRGKAAVPTVQRGYSRKGSNKDKRPSCGVFNILVRMEEYLQLNSNWLDWINRRIFLLWLASSFFYLFNLAIIETRDVVLK